MNKKMPPQQRLHLVFGGELKKPGSAIDFRDVSKLDIVGLFPDYATAYSAWKSAAQSTVDSAHTRYFILHIHHLLEPEPEPEPEQKEEKEEKESEIHS
ncbi:MAG: DUF4170 domain-containing protein [Alphaproteobacteria bacterium]|nr:DUF4170 domain-containing protein [Alphaproteobacteria bacterium]